MSEMLSNKQEELKIKELQRFFNKIIQVILIPKGNKMAPNAENPAFFIFMSQKDLIDVKDYDINNTIKEILDNKYPVLHMKIDEETFIVDYSIQDDESGLKFPLFSFGVTKPLMDFFDVADPLDKIPMYLGALEGNDKLIFDEDLSKNLVLILDGFFLE